MSTKTRMTTAAMVDPEGDELRVERLEDSFYLTASQAECTATVGPFTRIELDALLALASMERGAL